MSFSTSASPRLSASAPVDDRDEATATLTEPTGASWDRLALSFEVMPPRNIDDTAKIDEIISAVAVYRPDYIAVTSSRRSGWLEGTANVISHITETTRMRPVAHLACTAGTKEEVDAGIQALVDAGVRGLLALRGDLEEGQDRLPDNYYQYATDLVREIREMEQRQAYRFAAGGLAVGVACYPSGHYQAKNADEDFDVLLAKQRLGADFAITQLFFDAEDYVSFYQQARLVGVTIPLIPGIMPITSVKRLERMASLSGLEVPDRLRQQLLQAWDAGGEAAEYDTGLNLTAQLAADVIGGGAGGLHIYTHNNAPVTKDLLSRIEQLRGHSKFS